MNRMIVLAAAVFLLVVALLSSELSGAQSGTPMPPPAMTATAMAATPTPSPTPPPEVQDAVAYISERENIPVADLLVVNTFEAEYELLGRAFQFVTVMDTSRVEQNTYDVLVDLESGEIVDDPAVVRAAEEESYLEKYGKLHPLLYQRLQEVDDETQLPVTFWVAPNPAGRSREEIIAILADRYPQVDEAMEQWGYPWAVSDSALRDQIEADFRQMLTEDVAVRVLPLVTAIQLLGVDVRTYDDLPSVSATLSKRDIELLAQRPDVSAVYLTERRETPAMDSAPWSNRAGIVWEAGVEGALCEGDGCQIGIVEAGRIDIDTSCLDILLVRDYSISESAHKTRVSSATACNNLVLPGIAPQAQLLDAAYDQATSGPEDGVQALNWALANGGDVFNTSVAWEDDPPNPNLNWSDRAYDYYARTYSRIITISAGNDGSHISSPGKGWNVLTVGGTNDEATAYWADDGDYADTSYINPDPAGSDREKPEIVAPGTNIRAYTLNNGTSTGSGTSLAASQIAGLVALLIDRNSELLNSAPAIRSIIMASAVHNLDGPTTTNSGNDLWDGAGAIDAALADQIAQTKGANGVTCNRPCWWHINTTSSYPGIGYSVVQKFVAARGERIRVAINWWSNADPPQDINDPWARDALDTNYHLHIYYRNPNNTLTPVATSDSVDNNYELVDFIADKTGTYEIFVYHASGNEAANQVGIAWVKDATYLPALHNEGSSEWQTQFFTLNGDSETSSIEMHYYDANGNPTAAWGTGQDTCNLSPDQRCFIPVWEYDRIPADSIGSATVSGGQAAALLVESLRPNGLTNYSGIASLAGEGWMMPGTMLYIPVVKKAYYGRSGHLHIFNPGTSSATVTPRFYEADTTSVTTCSNITIQPGARRTYHPSNCSGLASNKIYGVRLTSNQPIAAIMTEDDDATHTRAATVNAFSSGDTMLYVPVVKSNHFGNVSAIIVQNTTANGTTASVTYRDIDSVSTWSTNHYVPPYSTHSFYVPDTVPANQMASAIVSAGQTIVATVYETKTTSGWYMQYNAFFSGAKSVILPRIMKNAGSDNWRTGVLIQNTNAVRSTTVTVRYFNAAGNELTAAMETFSVAPRESVELYTNSNPGVSNGFDGSAVVTSYPYAVAVQVNVATDRPGDAAMSYSGIVP